MGKVVVTDYSFETLDTEKQILEPLGCEVLGYQCKSTEELIPIVADADYVITQFAPVNFDVINAMKKCKIIVRYGIGVDNVDLETARQKGIPVCNVPDYCIDEVADHALALILALNRRIVQLCIRVRNGLWKSPVSLQSMNVLKKMTVGIIGFGRIGREVAKRLNSFKCNIIVFDPVVNAQDIKNMNCTSVTLDELFEKSDLITLHCPSNTKTKYMVNKESLKKMKKGILLVNTSRGTLIKSDDLIEALKNGHVAGAGLDVTDPEPINSDSPLLKMENVIITNHVAAYSIDAMNKLQRSVADTVACAVKGEKLPNVVNNVQV